MRVVVSLAAILLASCSSLLGIEDPRARDGGDRDHLAFRFGDFRLAQLQTARLHVQLVLASGTMQDVTATAMYGSSNDTVATAIAGVVSAGSQAGTATITASLGAALPATLTVTVTATACHPVINELATGGTTGADEWVEIYNPCTNAIDVSGWTLNYRAASATGGADTNLMVTLIGTMAPGELRLFAGRDYAGASDGIWPDVSGIMQQTSGAVGLRTAPMNASLVDSIAYGAATPGNPFIETNPTGPMANGRSASRLPFDGKDTDDGGADVMVIATQTPRALNAP